MQSPEETSKPAFIRKILKISQREFSKLKANFKESIISIPVLFSIFNTNSEIPPTIGLENFQTEQILLCKFQ